MASPAIASRSGAAAFDRDGFAVLDAFLDGGELEGLRAQVDAVLARPLPAGCQRPHNTLAPLRWNDAVVVAALSSADREARLAEAVGAEDLRWISGYVSVKEPHSEALGWHQDWWCWDHPVTYRRPASQVAVLCYLADTSTDTAALRVLPGSHRRGAPLHADETRDQPGQRTLAVRAGDAVAIDYRLLHGTHPNAGSRRRNCLVLTFAPSWRTLPDDVRAHLIRHLALPRPGEPPPAPPWPAHLLPRYDGIPRDLPLSRAAPARFATRS